MMCAFDSPGCVFFPWFLLPLLGDYDGCVLPGIKFSVDLFPCPAHLMFSVVCLLVLDPEIKG